MAARVQAALKTHRWLTALVFTGVVLLFANHLLLRGLATAIWDADAAALPYQVLVADHARAGRLVSWDPWSNGGLPILGDPQVGGLSPIAVLTGLITGGTSLGFKVYWLLMWWLGGVGILMLARHLKVPAWGATVVAVGFLFCGIYTTNAEHTPLLIGFSFIPAIIWRLDVGLTSRRWQPAVEAGALWGLSGLAAYPAFTILTGCAAGLWAIGRALFSRPAGVSRLRSICFAALSMTAFGTVGLVVLAPPYWAFFYEGAGTNTRTGALDRAAAVFNDALSPGAIATLASPYFTILKAYNSSLWPGASLVMTSVYSGVCVVVLAFFSLVMRPLDKWRWWLVALALLGFGCACGQALPLRGWLYDYFYPSRFFRHPGIFRSYFIFFVTVLALFGVRDLASLLRPDALRRDLSRFAIVSCLTAAAALLIFALVVRSVPPAELRLTACVHAVVMWLGVCVLAVWSRWASSQVHRWAIPALLLGLCVIDALVTSRLSHISMYDTRSYYVERWKDLDQHHVSNLDLTSTGTGLRRDETVGNTNDQMISKVPVFESYATSGNEFHAGMAKDPVLLAAVTGNERIWFAQEAASLPPTAQSFAAFALATQQRRTPLLVIHSREEMLKRSGKKEDPETSTPTEESVLASLPEMKRVKVDLTKYSPDELAFTVDCPADGWLLVTDRWGRSWRAEINDEAVPVYPGNFIFRAVRVSQGMNRVRFSYHPFGFPWLVLASWGTLAGVALSSAYFRPQRSVATQQDEL